MGIKPHILSDYENKFLKELQLLCKKYDVSIEGDHLFALCFGPSRCNQYLAMYIDADKTDVGEYGTEEDRL